MTTPAVRSDIRDHVSPGLSGHPSARLDGRPRHAPSLMRRYEAAALLSDLSVCHATVTAPALPFFEEATAAFARGTLIRTIAGPVAIEDLVPGDYVETGRGAEAVTWIGSTTYVPRVESAESALTGLTRVLGDALGPARPGADLVLGPGARMVVENARLERLIGEKRVLVPVSEFADGEGILRIAPGGAVQLYHLALRRHAVIEVGGVEMETYHPGTGIRRQLGEAHAERFLRLFPNVPGLDAFGELGLPRTSRTVLDTLDTR